MTVSPEQLHVLRLAEAGRDCTMVPLVNGKGSQSRTVGRGATVSLCRHNGWIIWNPSAGYGGQGQYELTDAGRAILAATAEREQAKRERDLRNTLRYSTHWEKGYRCHGLWTNMAPHVEGLTPSVGQTRLGRVALGPPGLWDGKTYSWLIDNPAAPDGAPLAEGEATSLKGAKQAVELGVARRLRGLPCTP